MKGESTGQDESQDETADSNHIKVNVSESVLLDSETVLFYYSET